MKALKSLSTLLVASSIIFTVSAAAPPRDPQSVLSLDLRTQIYTTAANEASGDVNGVVLARSIAEAEVEEQEGTEAIDREQGEPVSPLLKLASYRKES